MKKTVINLLVIFGIVLVTFFGTRAYYPKTEQVVKTDTVRVDVPFEVTKIKEVEKPVRVTEYKRDTVTVEKVRVEKDTVYVSTNDNTYQYVSTFLSTYPNSPRFLHLRFANPELELTYQKPDGNVRSKLWDVGDRGYRVGLNNGQPNIETFKEPSTDFSYGVEGGYIRFFSQGSPYLELSTEFHILGLNTTATLNANQNPFATVGVSYQFD